MKNSIMLLILSINFSCTSKIKEGSEINIYNGTKSDIYLLDKSNFEVQQLDKPVKIFSYGIDNFNNYKERPYLNPEYITMYTNKTIIFSDEDYKRNKVYESLIFYIIKRKNLSESKRTLLNKKLYDSIIIDFNDFHLHGTNNNLYIEENRILFKDK